MSNQSPAPGMCAIHLQSFCDELIYVYEVVRRDDVQDGRECDPDVGADEESCHERYFLYLS